MFGETDAMPSQGTIKMKSSANYNVVKFIHFMLYRYNTIDGILYYNV